MVEGEERVVLKEDRDRIRGSRSVATYYGTARICRLDANSTWYKMGLLLHDRLGCIGFKRYR